MNIQINPDWWKTMFDEVYLLTDARSVCDDTITRHEVDAICQLLPIQTHHKILDLCGGHGRHCFELCERGFQNCTLLDYSSHLIDVARKRVMENGYPLNLIQSDARSTQLESESFDHVCIMGNSLGYINTADADSQILSEAFRLLCSDGWILVDVTNGAIAKEKFNPNTWHEIGNDIVVCRERELFENKIHAREVVLSKLKGIIRDCTYAIRLYEPPALSSLLEQVGFINLKLHTDFSPHGSKGDYGFMNHRILAIGQKPG